MSQKIEIGREDRKVGSNYSNWAEYSFRIFLDDQELSPQDYQTVMTALKVLKDTLDPYFGKHESNKDTP